MEQISVRILDRDYRLAVPAEGKDQLIEAARAVDERMCALHARVPGLEVLKASTHRLSASGLVHAIDLKRRWVRAR